jgi:hypothetical protein
VVAVVGVCKPASGHRSEQFHGWRPGEAPEKEEISLEGDATDVVITSEVTDLYEVFDVSGLDTSTVTWAPRKAADSRSSLELPKQVVEPIGITEADDVARGVVVEPEGDVEVDLLGSSHMIDRA